MQSGCQSWLLLLLGLIHASWLSHLQRFDCCFHLFSWNRVMLFIWYLWAVKYYWVPISLIVVKVCQWAVLCPPVKDFILLRETLPRLVLYGCRFTLFLCCQVLDYLVCFLAVIISEACFYLLALILCPSLFCHHHLCPDLSFNLSIVFGFFWLASLFLQVSSLVT